jgi:glycosyltransferase involved in cell wall biosynthesis
MILFAFKDMQLGGGAEKNLIEVALHVARRRPVGFYFAGGQIDPRIPAAGPVFLMPGKGRFWAAPLDLVHLAWLVLRHRVELIHAHHRYPAFLASLLRKVLPFRLLTTVHNRFPNRARASLWGDRPLAVSEDIAQWLRDECGIAASAIRVVHNGIEDPPRHAAEELQALRAECGAPPGAPLLCAVGRLSAQKNHALLFEALARLTARPWHLLMVGEGELRADLEALARDRAIAERVRFLGRRSDVPRILQASDLMVMSSAWEGFPYVVIEALANALPVIATDVGGVREGVVDDVTGLLAAPGDAAALAQAIARGLDDTPARARWAQAGRAMFEQRFRIDAMLAAIDEEIERLAATR